MVMDDGVEDGVGWEKRDLDLFPARPWLRKAYAHIERGLCNNIRPFKTIKASLSHWLQVQLYQFLSRTVVSVLGATQPSQIGRLACIVPRNRASSLKLGRVHYASQDASNEFGRSLQESAYQPCILHNANLAAQILCPAPNKAHRSRFVQVT